MSSLTVLMTILPICAWRSGKSKMKDDYLTTIKVASGSRKGYPPGQLATAPSMDRGFVVLGVIWGHQITATRAASGLRGFLIPIPNAIGGPFETIVALWKFSTLSWSGAYGTERQIERTEVGLIRSGGKQNSLRSLRGGHTSRLHPG